MDGFILGNGEFQMPLGYSKGDFQMQGGDLEILDMGEIGLKPGF